MKFAEALQSGKLLPPALKEEGTHFETSTWRQMPGPCRGRRAPTSEGLFMRMRRAGAKLRTEARDPMVTERLLVQAASSALIR